ncbi:helix-turn-helix domain-containing protein [Sutcliffiella cohnii]|uniref:Helix-turn-helix domain-containing protein n=1 Tax=Sutcliffiella cohnii TaxID=33932 RepID=A0A223KNP4_9BACI|nr:helix-turn-helix domain-containing protein [Sutcliffiella cohnii]AST91092.1 hypothetical protein BC6307_07270 [Sutcliffiella cohnii]
MEKFSYEMIQSYQSFQSIEEMDKCVRGFLYIHKGELSEGTISVLKFIWRHSVKVPGVSFAKNDTIAQFVGVSKRTVIRAINKLEELHILKRVHTARKNGKQGVNLLIIQSHQPIDELKNTVSSQPVTLDDTPIKQREKHQSLCENTNRNDVKDDKNAHPEKENLVLIDSSFLPDTIHQNFIQAADPFFSAIEIYKLWKRVLIAYNKINFNRPLEELMHVVVSSFKQSMFMKKMKKIRSTFEGYFYRVLHENFIVEKRRENRHLMYDFIAEFEKAQPE